MTTKPATAAPTPLTAAAADTAARNGPTSRQQQQAPVRWPRDAALKVGDHVDYFFDGMQFQNYKYMLADRSLQSAKFVIVDEEVTKRVPVLDADADEDEPEEARPICLPLDESLPSSSPRVSPVDDAEIEGTPRLKKQKKSGDGSIPEGRFGMADAAGDHVADEEPAGRRIQSAPATTTAAVLALAANPRRQKLEETPATSASSDCTGAEQERLPPAEAAAELKPPRRRSKTSDLFEVAAEQRAAPRSPLRTKVVKEVVKSEYMQRPVWGKAYGWVRGVVLRILDDDPNARPCIEVEPLDKNLCYVECGEGKVDNSSWRYKIFHENEVKLVPHQDVKVSAPAEAGDDAGDQEVEQNRVKCEAARTSERPLLSMFMTRWFDYWTCKKKSEYKITCQYPMQALIDYAGVKDAIGNDFECYMLFVKDEACLRSFYASDLSVCMRGHHRVALYYLWPTQKWLGRVRVTHADHPRNNDDGMVSEADFFAFCQKVEDMDIKTKYPAPSSVYRQLCGKQYYNHACLNATMQTPATTRVHAASIRSNSKRAARDAIFALERITRYKRAQALARRRGDARSASTVPESCTDSLADLMPEEDNEEELPQEVRTAREKLFRESSGVVKLGFSWMGVDVMKFEGVAELEDKLKAMVEQPTVTGKCSRIGASVIVQALVPHRIAELRVHSFCVPEKARVPIPHWYEPKEWVSGPDGRYHEVNVQELLMKARSRSTDDMKAAEGDASAPPASGENNNKEAATEKADEEAETENKADAAESAKMLVRSKTEKSIDRFKEYCNSSAMTTMPGFDLKVAYMTVGMCETRGFDMTTHICQTPEMARDTVWRGDEKMQQKMENQARQLAKQWLLWYASEWPERYCPANARFDFHVSWDRERSSEPELFVCEVTECGASLCGLPIQARNTALVYSFFEGATAKKLSSASGNKHRDCCGAKYVDRSHVGQEVALPGTLTARGRTRSKSEAGVLVVQPSRAGAPQHERGAARSSRRASAQPALRGHEGEEVLVEEEVELQTKWPTGDWKWISTVDKSSSSTWYTWPFGTDVRTNKKRW